VRRSARASPSRPRRRTARRRRCAARPSLRVRSPRGRPARTRGSSRASSSGCCHGGRGSCRPERRASRGRRRRPPRRPRVWRRPRRRRSEKTARAPRGRAGRTTTRWSPERLLPRIRVSAAFEQIEPVGEPREDLLGREDGGTRRGELERERQVVEPFAELGDGFGRLERGLDRGGPRREEAQPLGGRELRDGVDLLSCQLQPLTARHDQLGAAQVAKRRDRLGGIREQMFGIVDHEEHPLAAEQLCQHVLECAAGLLDHVERLRGVPKHERGVAQRRERHPPDAVVELVRCLGCSLEREPGLTRAAGAGEGEQADAVRKPFDHLVELPGAAQEVRRGNRQVRPVQRPRPRELGRPELEQPLRCREVLQAVLAKVADVEAVVQQVAGGAGDERLPAMRRSHDPRRPVNVDPDVIGWVEDRLAGVDTDPDPHRPVLERRERLAHGVGCSGRRREREEEAVAGGVDLVAAVAVEVTAHGLPMLFEHAPVLLRPEGVEELRRSLDVREDERDRSGRLLDLRHAAIIPDTRCLRHERSPSRRDQGLSPAVVLSAMSPDSP
jgi:hypothetical protein